MIKDMHGLSVWSNSESISRGFKSLLGDEGNVVDLVALEKFQFGFDFLFEYV